MTAQTNRPHVVIVLLAAALLMGMGIRAAFSGGTDRREARLVTAYETLRGFADFTGVSVMEDRLALRRADGSVQLLELTGSLDVFRDLAADAWQCGDDVYFVLGGVGSDRWGYAFSADGSLCLDHLRSVEPVHLGSPNVYQFQTER